MRLTPADLVIQRFGGLRPAARALDIETSTIMRWRKRSARKAKAKRLTSPTPPGTIPSRWHPQILAAALKARVPMTPLELLYGGDAE